MRNTILILFLIVGCAKTSDSVFEMAMNHPNTEVCVEVGRSDVPEGVICMTYVPGGRLK